MAESPMRRRQADRTAETRARLIEAAIESLVEQGYRGTTTASICERAAVTHGALLHQFGRRDALLGEALRTVYGRLRDRVVAGLEALPAGEARVSAMVDLMWSAFGDREFKAVLELWLAARNEPELEWADWPEARAFGGGSVPLTEGLFPDLAARIPDFPVYASLLVQTLQGMGLAESTLRDGSEGAARRGQVRALLSRILREAFADGVRGDGWREPR